MAVYHLAGNNKRIIAGDNYQIALVSCFGLDPFDAGSFLFGRRSPNTSLAFRKPGQPLRIVANLNFCQCGYHVSF